MYNAVFKATQNAGLIIATCGTCFDDKLTIKNLNCIYFMNMKMEEHYISLFYYILRTLGIFILLLNILKKEVPNPSEILLRN